jgi:hypothetical protein
VSEVTTDLESLYLPLLRSLTERLPLWGIWKNVDRAFAGHGDIDSAAPRSDWPSIESEFRRWAADHGLGPVAACHHIRGVLFLIALDPSRRTFFELDVNARKYFRGAVLFRSEQLRALAEVERRGFRRLRPGAEGLILVTQNGMRWGGRSAVGEKAREGLELIRTDLDGADRAARTFFGSAAPQVMNVVDAGLEGAWDRRAAAVVEARAVLTAVQHPLILAGRFLARRLKKHDTLLRSIFVEDRKLPEDLKGWIERVARRHPVYTDA